MKKIIFMVICSLPILISSCGSSSKDVDICRCLSEPGNSEYMQKNEVACDEAISKKLGVNDWKKVNFSQNPELQAKWDKMARDCGH